MARSTYDFNDLDADLSKVRVVIETAYEALDGAPSIELRNRIQTLLAVALDQCDRLDGNIDGMPAREKEFEAARAA